MNIIWKEWETYQLKQAIPKFIVWVLIVPFSMLIVKFVISVAWILSAAILSLPIDTFPDYETRINQVEVCRDLHIKSDNWKTTIECWEDGNWIKKALEFNSINMYGILNIYTYWIFWVENILKFDENKPDAIQTVVQLIAHLWFSTIFIVVYVLLLIALFLALVTRGIYLWIFTVMSPVFGLLYFFNKNEGWEWVMAKLNFKQFINLALIPVYVSAALSFGLLFIYVASNAISDPNTSNENMPQISENGKEINFLDFKITSNTALLWDNSESVQNFFWWIKNTFWIFIAQMFALVVLWMSVMAALKSSDITKEVIQPIVDFGNSIWQLATKAPTYAPIIPTKDGFMSAEWLWRAWSTFSWAIQWEAQKSWVDFWNRMAWHFGVWESDIQEIRNLINWTAKTALTWNHRAIEKYYKDLISKVDMDKLTTNKQYREEFIRALEHSWAKVSDDLKKEFINNWTSAWNIWRTMQQIRTENSSNSSVYNPMNNIFGTTSWQIQESLAWQSINTVSWDVKENQVYNYGKYTEKYNEIDGNHHILIDSNASHWVWSITIRDTTNEDLWKELSLKFDQTAKDDIIFKWNDIKEALALYEAIWGDKDRFKAILEKLKFTEIDKLYDYIDLEYNKTKK